MVTEIAKTSPVDDISVLNQRKLGEELAELEVGDLETDITNKQPSPLDSLLVPLQVLAGFVLLRPDAAAGEEEFLLPEDGLLLLLVQQLDEPEASVEVRVLLLLDEVDSEDRGEVVAEEVGEFCLVEVDCDSR